MPVPFPIPKETLLQKGGFERAADGLWAWQLENNPVMAEFCRLIGNTKQQCLPISFFKDYTYVSGKWEPEMTFKSSGTTGMARSQHLVKDLSIYRHTSIEGFFEFFPRQQYSIFGLLPNYLQQGDSSLVFMVTEWIKAFGLPGSGFYLDNFTLLRQALVEAMDRREPILLIGVSYALLDFIEEESIQLPPDAIVMETGGMKGRKAEMVRDELHTALKAGFGLEKIYSEYGMTELLSQAYSDGSNRFRCPPWMRVEITDAVLPGVQVAPGQLGRINVIDLANVHSCAFIRTDDMGRVYEDGSFEVVGRLDHAEMRGCNLLYVTPENPA